jgi:centromeric protein E
LPHPNRYYEETRSTLQFASRAKLVKTNAVVNEIINESEQLKRLTKELNLLKEKQKECGISDTEYSRLGMEIRELQREKEEQRVKYRIH